jgi:hypothetical protein
MEMRLDINPFSADAQTSPAVPGGTGAAGPRANKHALAWRCAH